jgi:glycosyltransferase
MSVMQDTAVDSCYGDLLYVDRDDPSRIVRYWKAGAWTRRSFLWGWMPPHPTFFVKKGVYASHGGFDLALGTSADYELMLRFLYKHRITAAYIPQVLVRMRSGGLSNASLAARLRANCMDWKAWRLNGLLPAPWTIIVKPLRKLYQYVNRPSSPEAGRNLRA